MAIIAQDTFARADQSGWGTASDGETWAQVAGSAATFAIASNEGTITGVTGATVELLGSKTLTDVNALVRFSVPATADSVSLIARSDAAGANGYLARYTSGNITLCTYTSSTVNVIQTTAFTLVVNTFYWLRLKCVGSAITVSIWQDGNPESGATVLTATNTTFTTAGQFGFRMSMAATGDVAKVDSFSIDDLIPVVVVPGYPPRYIRRALGATIIPEPIKQPLPYIGRALSATIIYESRTFVPRALGGVYMPDTVMWVPRALSGTEQVALLRPVTLSGTGTLTGTLTLATSLSGSYTSRVIGDVPQAYYRLDETSGTNAADSSGNGNAGVYAGTYTQNVAGCLLTDPDTAWLIASTTAKVTVPSGLNQNGSNAFSVEAWINPTNALPALSAFYSILTGPWNGSTQGWVLYQFNNAGVSQLSFTVANGTTNVGTTTNFSLTAGSVYHLVGTYDGTNARLYINGVLKTTSGVLTGPCVNSGSPTIGAATSSDFQGVIDEVAIYNSVLVQQQITTHYLAGTTYLLSGIGTLTPTLSANLTLPSGTLAGAGTLAGSLFAVSQPLPYIGRALGSTIIYETRTFVPRALSGVYIPDTILPVPRALLSTIQATVGLGCTLAGIGTLSGTFTLATALTDTMAGVGTLSATLSTTGGVSLTCTMAGVGTLSGTLSLATNLTDTLAGVGTLSGTLSANLTLASVTTPGVGTLAATMTAQVILSTSLAGAGTLSGVYSLRVALSLTFAGAGTLAGVISIPSLSFLTATWVTRDGLATWVTRDGKIAWVTRDEKAAWDTRDSLATWDTRDEQALWKTRS